jgi:two-component system phosphate regulon sensor histidine kinase PhoR
VESEERVRPATPVELRALLQSAAGAMRTLAAERGVAIEIAGEEGEVRVKGDADQLIQVVTNLIQNAVKYAASGKSVTLDLSTLARDPVLGAPAARIAVIDRGEGFDPIHIPRLTERFYRIDDHRSRAEGGTGLGLAIVKHIVGRHRGRLQIESAPGEGSRFTVILPMERA